MNNKIILNLAISLDGFIADKDGGYDWIQPAGKSELNTTAIWSHDNFLEGISAVVMGKKCYDQQMHLEYQNKQVYVATSKDLKDYDNVHFIGKDICCEVSKLKQEQDGDIYLFGGGIVIDPLLKAQLIDEYIIGIIPTILGEGIPLFQHGDPSIPLQLTNYYVEDGIVVLRYIPRESTDNSR